ncbi:MAG: ribosome maturation factor RimM [Arenimonas sp.]
MTDERRILLGRVLGAFGVRGEVKLQSFTDPESTLLRYQPWLLVHAGSEREIIGATGRQTAKGVIGTLPGIADRDAAQALAGAEIYVPRSRMPKPKPGEYYWVDLEGLEVVNREGVSLGHVSHLFDTGSNQVLVAKGERDRLIPFIEGEFVLGVDFGTGRIEVDWDADF